MFTTMVLAHRSTPYRFLVSSTQAIVEANIKGRASAEGWSFSFTSSWIWIRAADGLFLGP